MLLHHLLHLLVNLIVNSLCTFGSILEMRNSLLSASANTRGSDVILFTGLLSQSHISPELLIHILYLVVNHASLDQATGDSLSLLDCRCEVKPLINANWFVRGCRQWSQILWHFFL